MLSSYLIVKKSQNHIRIHNKCSPIRYHSIYKGKTKRGRIRPSLFFTYKLNKGFL
ncbi:hypothetical protein BCN_1760 [Bacillus cereus NC7401]|nr:hypothetical protein BCN_1760 [Bacillus cereus NC7401]